MHVIIFSEKGTSGGQMERSYIPSNPEREVSEFRNKSIDNNRYHDNYTYINN